MEDGIGAEFGQLLWDWFRTLLFYLSIIGIGLVLIYLPAMSGIAKTSTAVVAVSYVTVVTIYFVLSHVLMRSLWIELLRRHRHEKFSDSDLRGELGGPVTRQIAGALIAVVVGYVALIITFGLAYTCVEDTLASMGLYDRIYYGVVNFGTVGYGSIQPSGAGKLIVGIHAIAYLLYQATAVAGVLAIISKIVAEPGIGLGFEIDQESRCNPPQNESERCQYGLTCQRTEKL